MSDSDVKAQGPRRETTLGHDLLRLARDRLGGRWVLVAVGALGAAGGIALSWDWLVAAGLAPLVVGVLPCLALCAAGLCMKGLGGRACDASGAPTKPPAAPAREGGAESSSAGGEGVSADSPHVSGRNVNR